MTTIPPPRSGPAVAMIVGSCISLQIGTSMAAQLFPLLGPGTVTALRLGLAAIVLLLIVRPQLQRWNRRQWGAVLAFGGALAGMNGFFYLSIARIPLGTAVALEFIGPLALAAILSRRLADGLWVALAVIGMTLFGVDSVTGERLDPLGVVYVLIAAVFWGLYILTSARVGRQVPGAGGLAGALAVAAVLVVPFGLGGLPTLVATPTLLLVGLGTALLASVLPYWLELSALRRLTPAGFGILLSLEPVVATVAGWVLLDQVATPLRLVAMTVVVVASIGSTVHRAHRDRVTVVRSTAVVPEVPSPSPAPTPCSYPAESAPRDAHRIPASTG